MGDYQRRELHESLLDADSFEDLPGKWQAAIVKAEENGRTCGSSATPGSRSCSQRPARCAGSGGGPRELA
jgi:hypothetical protein